MTQSGHHFLPNAKLNAAESLRLPLFGSLEVRLPDYRHSSSRIDVFATMCRVPV